MRDAKWKKVHAELTRLATAKGEYDADEARWLLEAQRLRVHEQVGYATLLEYLERLFGYGPRMAKERLRVAEALANLPAIREALATGALAWSGVRELSPPRRRDPASSVSRGPCSRGKLAEAAAGGPTRLEGSLHESPLVHARRDAASSVSRRPSCARRAGSARARSSAWPAGAGRSAIRGRGA